MISDVVQTGNFPLFEVTICHDPIYQQQMEQPGKTWMILSNQQKNENGTVELKLIRTSCEICMK